MYIIFNIEELPKIDFSVACETSQYTVRKSLDGTKTFVKWDTNEPPWFLDLLNTKKGPYNLDEMSNILLSSEWSHTNPKPAE